jgi:hypothetical protein
MRRSNLNQLNTNDRHLLTYYTNLYNQKLRDINMMYIELKEIKNNIDTITGVNNVRREPLRNIYYRMEYIPIPDLESVPVVASQDVINRNTRRVRFNEVINPLNFDCPISLDRFQDNSMLTQIIGCGHLFCNNEITRWFRTNVHCPVCRYDIRDIIQERTDSINNSPQTTEEPRQEEESQQEEYVEEEPQQDNINNRRSSRRRSSNSIYRTYTNDISLNEITEDLINSFFSNYSLNGYS